MILVNFIFFLAGIVMIIYDHMFGVLITLVSFFGCWGILTDNKCMMWTFATVMALILVAEIGIAVSVVIYKEKANDLGIVCSVWLNPGAATAEDLDHKALFEIHRKAMAQAIHKAMCNEPSIDWLLENQDAITHKYYQKGLDGTL